MSSQGAVVGILTRGGASSLFAMRWHGGTVVPFATPRFFVLTRSFGHGLRPFWRHGPDYRMLVFCRLAIARALYSEAPCV